MELTITSSNTRIIGRFYLVFNKTVKRSGGRLITPQTPGMLSCYGNISRFLERWTFSLAFEFHSARFYDRTVDGGASDHQRSDRSPQVMPM